MNYRLKLTYSETLILLDMEYIKASTLRYTVEPGICKINDINLMLKSIHPNEWKVKITIHDITLESNILKI